MSSKFIDPTAIVQTIGCVYNNPSILEISDNYVITENDFVEDFHKIVYGAIYKLYENGVKKITIEAINDFLETRPKSKKIYDNFKGNEYLQKVSKIANISTFDYYYNRLKKMSLLRAYDNFGLDLTFLYDPDNIIDIKKKEFQEAWLDNSSLEDIAETIDNKIGEIRDTYVNTSLFGATYNAGDGIEDLILSFEKSPDVGVPLYGNFINTVTKGARLGKFYLRSAPTGVGKTRSMIADACNIACHKIYDDLLGWIGNGKNFPVLFIGTEQDKSEIQTMMLAFLSGVDEDHIMNGKYEEGERERVFEAAKIIQESPLYIEELPEFNLQDVENAIKRNIRERDVQYIFFDYIHTSIKILEEISRRAGKIALREDNILFMLSTKLKDICVKYNVFLMSATQLNGDYKESKTPDQNLLRGAKAIADKIDYGSILLPVQEVDIESLSTVLGSNPSFGVPTIKLSVYKNRRGKYKGVVLWCSANLGTCRIQPLFMTDFQYELQSIENIKIAFKEDTIEF